MFNTSASTPGCNRRPQTSDVAAVIVVVVVVVVVVVAAICLVVTTTRVFTTRIHLTSTDG